MVLAMSVTVASGASHPRIFITPDDLPRLRAMRTETGKNALGFVPADAWRDPARATVYAYTAEVFSEGGH